MDSEIHDKKQEKDDASKEKKKRRKMESVEIKEFLIILVKFCVFDFVEGFMKIFFSTLKGAQANDGAPAEVQHRAPTGAWRPT